MEQADLRRMLEAIAARLDGLDARIAEAERLRAALDDERQSRRELAEQTRWLIETLGETRKELRWLRQERERLLGGDKA